MSVAVAIVPLLLSLAVHQLGGFVWYGPAFGKLFINLAHPNGLKSDADFNMVSALVIMLIGSLFPILITGFAVDLLQIATASQGALLGVLLSAFGAGHWVSHPAFEQRPMALFVLHEAFHVVVSAGTGAIYGYYAARA